ncbi:hypothetical protein CA267_018170 [Alteromonas pelagimontana]|uniref:Uncharacterized protein n=1 Tax=Alteromonas pelagimontana TaxID=1858656 RepID=A0A6M4MHQ0_9ALTE|nr:hypothetical protein [Alteromonas pelagimontana]QJR82542.1 hypothetical protein CA267_018170 [Alteromonas pelagimontana]
MSVSFFDKSRNFSCAMEKQDITETMRRKIMSSFYFGGYCTVDGQTVRDFDALLKICHNSRQTTERLESA